MTLKQKIQLAAENIFDYGPIVVTVILGAYVTSQTINKDVDITELAEWILSILVLVAATQLVDRFRVLRVTEKKIDQLVKFSQGQGGINGVLLESMPDLRERLKVSKSISISGVSLAGTSNMYHPVLQDRVRAGVPIRLLTTDPSSDKPVAEVAVYRIEKTQDTNILRRSINHSLETFSLLAALDHKKRFKIRVLPYPTIFGIWILDYGTDDAEVWVELYSFRQTPEPAFQLLPRRDGVWYDFFVKQFENMWNASNEWDPATNTVKTTVQTP